MHVGAWTSPEVERLCRTHGLALTVQRRVIIDDLLRRHDHPTVDDVFDAVATRLPGLSRTTVYRVLETFVRVGLLRKVNLAGAAVRFDPCVERHHHFTCEGCGTLVDVPDSLVAPLDLGSLRGLDVGISDYSINFTGRCASCRDGAARSKSSNKRRKKESWPRTSREPRPTRT